MVIRAPSIIFRVNKNVKRDPPSVKTFMKYFALWQNTIIARRHARQWRVRLAVLVKNLRKWQKI